MKNKSMLQLKEIRPLKRGTHCRSVSGVFWITWKGSQDHLLYPGTEIMIPRRARSVKVQLLEQAPGCLEM